MLFSIITIFYAVKSLRSSDQNFVLFTKILDEHLNFYSTHFNNLYQNVERNIDGTEIKNFFSIFIINPEKTSFEHFVQQKKYRKFKKSSNRQIIIWCLKFLTLIALFLLIPILKYFVLMSHQTQIYNQFTLHKSFSYYQVILPVTLQIITIQSLLITSTSFQQNNFTENQINFAHAFQRFKNASFSTNIMSKLMTNSDYSLYYENLQSNNICDFINSTNYCSNPITKNYFKNGLRSIISQFSNTVDLLSEIFVGTSFSADNAPSFTKIYSNELQKLYFTIYPLFKKFSEFW